MSLRSEELLRRALRRRELLLAVGALGSAALWQAACGSGDPGEQTTARSEKEQGADPVACVLTPESTAGPYYVANRLTRRDITEGRPGVPLALHVTVVEADGCHPIEAADVEVWHADADGVYSGGEGDRGRFLRGHQRSDASGRVRFDTVYPGWYPGRAPHIHLKVHVGGFEVHTGQLFFDDETSAAVYGTADYRARGQAETTNETDDIYAAAGAGEAELRTARRGGEYAGRIKVGVRT